MHKKIWILFVCVLIICCILAFGGCSDAACSDMSESSTEMPREYETLNFDI